MTRFLIVSIAACALASPTCEDVKGIYQGANCCSANPDPIQGCTQVMEATLVTTILDKDLKLNTLSKADMKRVRAKYNFGEFVTPEDNQLDPTTDIGLIVEDLATYPAASAARMTIYKRVKTWPYLINCPGNLNIMLMASVPVFGGPIVTAAGTLTVDDPDFQAMMAAYSTLMMMENGFRHGYDTIQTNIYDLFGNANWAHAGGSFAGRDTSWDTSIGAQPATDGPGLTALTDAIYTAWNAYKGRIADPKHRITMAYELFAGVRFHTWKIMKLMGLTDTDFHNGVSTNPNVIVEPAASFLAMDGAPVGGSGGVFYNNQWTNFSTGVTEAMPLLDYLQCHAAFEYGGYFHGRPEYSWQEHGFIVGYNPPHSIDPQRQATMAAIFASWQRVLPTGSLQLPSCTTFSSASASDQAKIRALV